MGKSVKRSKQYEVLTTQLVAKRRGDMLYVTSPNLGGLEVWGRGAAATWRLVDAAIRAWYKRNKGFEVEPVVESERLAAIKVLLSIPEAGKKKPSAKAKSRRFSGRH